MTVRQPTTNILIINGRTGSERALSCLGVQRLANGSIEVQTAEQVFETLEHPCEVLLISDRGPCWHRFRTQEAKS